MSKFDNEIYNVKVEVELLFNKFADTLAKYPNHKDDFGEIDSAFDHLDSCVDFLRSYFE